MSLGEAALQELTAPGFSSLVATASADAGIVYDESGRRYGRTYSVTTVDSGTSAAFLVTVVVDWRDATGRLTDPPQTTTVSAILSRKPDGG